MSDAGLPLVGRAPDAVLFRLPGQEVTAAAFLQAARALAGALPDGAHVVNLCQDRLRFALGFAAALLRGQLTLMTADRSPARLAGLAAAYPGLYAVTDEGDGGAGGLPGHVVPALTRLAPLATLSRDAGEGQEPAAVPFLPLPLREGVGGRGDVARSRINPSPQPPPARGGGDSIPADRPAALVFTSGSTGEPLAHRKAWGALAARSGDAGAVFGLDAARPHSIVAMVPPQHMYGFETSVLLPLHAACSVWCGAGFYPGDVQAALAAVPAPRLLVTTPLQLRALLAAGLDLAPLDAIVSATAPLSAEMAAAAEARFGTTVREIFGATEVGSIAHRRTLDGPDWHAYPSVRLSQAGAAATVEAPFAPPFPLSDVVEVADPARFRLLGRRTDVVKLAGRRASLAELSRILAAIDGVVDGAFVAPDDLEQRPTARLLAFAVAPERSPADILDALRRRVDPVFLPRRVICVDALPRNAVGKLPAQALARLAVTAGEA